MKIITGASRGIGKYLMEKYLNKGETVYGTYLSTEPDSKYREFLSKVDISDHAEVAKWVGSLKFDDKIELINCAATNYNAFAHKADPTKWKKTIEINLIGTFNVINALLPEMRKNNYGRIINFSSVVAKMGVAGTSAYASSKAALWGLSKSIAVENASKGITINSLNLGYFNIGMISDVSSEIQEKIKEKIPSNSFGDPINIYNSVNYIIASDYINGASIDINGCII
ncbi:MAG TPA: SDR family NAD(P)-dependent oxidoreductase [Bacteroidales bacterium]|nr:SDR family NAD(P)-dependent oxidoreductase [Bacteroidales bacterium]HPS17092.1 SDR family NAD(P)-dependent oxidoreductase [Bacteroidales bacterium]